MFRRKHDDRDGPMRAGEESKTKGQPGQRQRAQPYPAPERTAPRVSAPTLHPEVPRRLTDIPAIGPRPAEYTDVPRSESKRLSVGKDICLSGTITACDKLIVEGSVEANLTDGRELQILRSGHYKGEVEVDDADIAGEFSGQLRARRRLVVRSTGKVKGTIRYGQIEVEHGGQIAGTLEIDSAAEPEAPIKPAGAGGFEQIEEAASPLEASQPAKP